MNTLSASVEDLTHTHRLNVLKWFLLALSVLLTPFDVNHFVQGNLLLGGIVASVIAVFLASAATIHYQGRAIIPPALLFVPIGGALWVAIAKQGIIGVFWVYPCVLLAHYTLRRLHANWVAAGLITMATVLVQIRIGSEIAVRVGATLLVTVVFANIFLQMIERLNAQMRSIAIIDPLTGAYNRRHMDDYMETPIMLKKRYGTPASLLLIDADNFKSINDTFGHAVGDEILRELATRLRASLRSVDLLFRVGGEEFAVLLPESELAGALSVAEKLRAAVAAQPFHADLPVTISVGLGELRGNEAFRALLKRCDDALYQAKADGRNCVRAAAPSTSQGAHPTTVRARQRAGRDLHGA
jgi:diguanylate cyclase (GGDEF)-like protein